METVMQGKVTGIKSYKGTIDGENIDSCTIFVESRLKGENSKGYATQNYRWGGSENAKKIAHLEFPVVCELRVEQVTDGRGGSSLVIVDVKPIARGGAAPQPKAA